MWRTIIVLFAVSLQIYVAKAQFECDICYRTESHSATRVTTTTVSTRTSCWVFFRCTNYRRQYRTESYNTYRRVAYCCRTTGTVNPLNGVVRLTGGSRENTGRLEVFYSARWGTVCDDLFGSSDARVACYQMGFTGESSYRTISGGTGTIWLDGLQCTGTETWLSSCRHNGWGTHDCSHSEDVGLTCSSSLQVRLVGGSNPLEGRVEYYKNGVWGTVCDDYFDSNDANVVCNQLGYGNAVRIRKFGSGSGSIVFDDLECSGDELSLIHCPYASTHNCGHSEDEGVVCQGPKATITRISSSSPSTVYLTWTTPWQLKFLNVVTGYIVQYSTIRSARSFFSARYSASTSSATISGLVGGSVYYFRIAVTVRGGQGPYSTFSSISTRNPAPLTPSACRGYATSPTTIVVRWSYPISTAGLTGYLISYDSVESSGISVDGEVRVSRSLSLYSIRLLEEDVQYQISIKSYFGRLYSRACTITVKTFTARPSGPPQNVRIPSKSSNSLSVSWSPPDLRHRNGPIVRYSVYVYPQSGGRPLYSYSAYRTSYEVSRLSPYTVYRVKVAAVTRNGTGPFSPLISERTTADVPGLPQDVVAIATGTNRIRLQWQPPTTRNGILSGYVVRYSSQGRLIGTFNHPTYPTRRDISGLSTYTRYSFQVASRNSRGTGAFSSVVYATTFSNVPSGPPTSVSVITIASTGIVVSWDLPLASQRNGEITSYSVSYGTSSSMRGRSTLTSLSTSMRINGLKPYRVYFVQVAASTVNGTGVYSGAISTRTYQDVPNAPPQNFQASVSTVLPRISVSWTQPPSDGLNGPLSDIYYVLKYSIIGSAVQRITVRSGSLQFVLTNLPYCKEYLLRVAAANSNGTGPFTSNIIETTTGLAHCNNPPQNVTIGATSSRSLVVTWQPPRDDGSNSEIDSYKIVYGELNEVSRTVTHTDTSSLQVNLTGLTPFTTYVVRVAAVRGVSVGVYSNTSYAKTLSEVPPKFDADSITFTSNARNVTLEWEPPKNAYGVVVGYVIIIRDVPSRKRSETTHEVGGHLTRYAVNNLAPFTNYCVQMAAVNEKGRGEASDDVCMKTKEDVPGPVVNLRIVLVTSTSLEVQWSPPTQANGVIVRYLLDYKSSNPTISPNSVLVVPANSSSFLVSNLQEGLTYEVKMRAETMIGPGQAVSVSASTYTAAPSGVPTDVNVTSQSPRSLLVTWSPPELAEHNGQITQYKVRFSQAGDGNSTLMSSSLSVVLDSLTPHTLYFVQVAAVNSNGTGPYSDIEEETTLPTSPSKPTNLMVDSPTSTMIVVTWEPPADPNGILSGYTLIYRAVSPEDLPKNLKRVITIPTLDVSVTSYRLPRLLEGVSYQVNVTATNNVGTSVPAVGRVTTKSTDPESPPIGLNVTEVTSRSVTLLWRAPPVLLRNGPLAHYLLRFYKVGSDEWRTKRIPDEDKETETTYTVEGLEPYTPYAFTVAVRNDVGESDYTNEVMQRTLEGVPSEVRNVSAELSETYVLISWSPPENPNGDIIHYQINVNGQMRTVVNDMVFEYNISNLKSKTQYEITVIAGNSAANSTGSKLVIRTLGKPDKKPVVTNQTVGPELYGLIVGLVVAVLCILFCVCLIVGFCVCRYQKVKAMATAHDQGLDYPEIASIKSGVYEEITDDFKATVAAIGKNLEEEDAKMEEKAGNHYTLGRDHDEKPYATPLVHVRGGSPTGSITDVTFIEGQYESLAPQGTVNMSTNGVYYNTHKGKVVEEVYEYSATEVSDPSNDYDVPRTGYDVPKAKPRPLTSEKPAPKQFKVSEHYETMNAIRLESASDSTGSEGM